MCIPRIDLKTRSSFARRLLFISLSLSDILVQKRSERDAENLITVGPVAVWTPAFQV
jgi:hypothetical protein